MDDSRIAMRIERWQPIGKRSRDKQKSRWKDVAIKEVKSRGAKGRIIKELAQDRSSWKRFYQKKELIVNNGGKRLT